MQGSRFVVVSTPAPEMAVSESVGERAGVMLWMLVSPNNRPIGRAPTNFRTYVACLDAVRHLCDNRERVTSVTSTVEDSGRWAWRVDLDGAAVAVSSRSYLRVRECHYNLERFLEALPSATIVPGTRAVRGGWSLPPTDRSTERSVR